MVTGVQETVQTIKKKTKEGAKMTKAAFGNDPPECAQFKPLERLWVVCPIQVYVYVLTASELKLGRRTSLTPFVTAQVSGRDEVKNDTLYERSMAKSKKVD